MCGQHAAVHFYLSLGLVRVCEIEISNRSKTREILIWCARKAFVTTQVSIIKINWFVLPV